MLHTTATMPQFRLKLDVPHKFALSPGYLNAVHARNFRPDRGDADDAWQDANTGLWMLKPSFATVDYYRQNNWKQLTAWRHDPNLWQQVIGAPAWANPSNPAADPAYISQTIANLWTSIDNGQNPAGSEIQALDIIGILAWSWVSAYSADFIKWVLQIRHGRRVYTIRGGVLESVYCPGCGGVEGGRQNRKTSLISFSNVCLIHTPPEPVNPP